MESGRWSGHKTCTKARTHTRSQFRPLRTQNSPQMLILHPRLLNFSISSSKTSDFLISHNKSLSCRVNILSQWWKFYRNVEKLTAQSLNRCFWWIIIYLETSRKKVLWPFSALSPSRLCLHLHFLESYLDRAGVSPPPWYQHISLPWSFILEGRWCLV